MALGWRIFPPRKSAPGQSRQDVQGFSIHHPSLCSPSPHLALPFPPVGPCFVLEALMETRTRAQCSPHAGSRAWWTFLNGKWRGGRGS